MRNWPQDKRHHLRLSDLINTHNFTGKASQLSSHSGRFSFLGTPGHTLMAPEWHLNGTLTAPNLVAWVASALGLFDLIEFRCPEAVASAPQLFTTSCRNDTKLGAKWYQPNQYIWIPTSPSCLAPSNQSLTGMSRHPTPFLARPTAHMQPRVGNVQATQDSSFTTSPPAVAKPPFFQGLIMA